MSEQIALELSGLRLTGPARVKRNSCIGAQVLVVSYDGAPHDAWAEAVSLAYSIYGAVACEDNTVGQTAQVDGVWGEKANLPSAGRRFGLTLNLWGLKSGPINKRLATLPKQH